MVRLRAGCRLYRANKMEAAVGCLRRFLQLGGRPDKRMYDQVSAVLPVHRGSTLWQYTVAAHRGSTLWQYTSTVHCGSPLLQYVVAVLRQGCPSVHVCSRYAVV